jgi:hypothetical protein
MEQRLELGEHPARLVLPAGSQLASLAGHAWITQSNERRDVVLRRGQALHLREPTTLLVGALRGHVSLRLTKPAATPVRTRLVHRLLQAASSTSWRRAPRTP